MWIKLKNADFIRNSETRRGPVKRVFRTSLGTGCTKPQNATKILQLSGSRALRISEPLEENGKAPERYISEGLRYFGNYIA